MRNTLIVGISVIHVWFMILQMFLWQSPLGLQAFKMTAEQANYSAVLAANQGVYNGLMALGLLFSLTCNLEVQWFFLMSIVVAGCYGFLSTGMVKILLIQALPAAVVLFMDAHMMRSLFLAFSGRN